MRALLTTVSLALMLGAVPATAQTKPDSVKKPKPAATMPVAKPAASVPAAPTASPSVAAPATQAKAASTKKHRKPKVKKPAN